MKQLALVLPGNVLLCFGLIFLIILCISCKKLPDWVPPEEGALSVEQISDLGSIPLQWGDLVSVTATAQQSSFECLLWFQDEEGIIRIVRYNMAKHALQPTVRVFNRK